MRKNMTKLITLLVLALWINPELSYAQGRMKTCLVNILAEATAQKKNELLREAVARQLEFSARQTVRSIFLLRSDWQKLTLFPISGPIGVVMDGIGLAKSEGSKSLWKLPFQMIHKDGGVLAGAVILSYVRPRLIVEQIDFDKGTSEYYDKLGKKVYVFASILEAGARLASVPRYEFSEKYEKYPNTHFIQANGYEDLKEKLIEIKKNYGSIYGLEIFGHGAIGELEDIDIKSLIGSGQYSPLTNVFLPGGKIILTSCSTGGGERGKKFTEEFGKLFLDKGGRVYSSKLTINSRLYEAYLKSKGLPDIATKTMLSISRNTALNFTVPVELLSRILSQVDEVLVSEPVRITDIPSQ